MTIKKIIRMGHSRFRSIMSLFSSVGETKGAPGRELGSLTRGLEIGNEEEKSAPNHMVYLLFIFKQLRVASHRLLILFPL